MQPKKAAGTGFQSIPNNEVRCDSRQQELVLACPGLSLLTLGRLKKGTTPRRYNVASMVEPLIGLPFSECSNRPLWDQPCGGERLPRTATHCSYRIFWLKAYMHLVTPLLKLGIVQTSTAQKAPNSSSDSDAASRMAASFSSALQS